MIKKLQDSNDALEKNRAELVQRIQELERELIRYQDEIKRRDLNSGSPKKKMMDDRHTKLSEPIQERQNEKINQLTKERDTLQKECDALKEELENIKANYSEAENGSMSLAPIKESVSASSDELEKVKRALKEAEAQYATIQDENIKLVRFN